MWISQEEYNKILKTFPIPCVDLIVENKHNEILMVVRKNEPAKGQWWSPGGRILHGENRAAAAKRKLKEECGIDGRIIKEIGTFDVLLDYHSDQNEKMLSHGISTFFHIKIDDESIVVLDNQSCQFEWRRPEKWFASVSNEVLLDVLSKL